jgi:hypothetical protein
VPWANRNMGIKTAIPDKTGQTLADCLKTEKTSASELAGKDHLPYEGGRCRRYRIHATRQQKRDVCLGSRGDGESLWKMRARLTELRLGMFQDNCQSRNPSRVVEHLQMVARRPESNVEPILRNINFNKAWVLRSFLLGSTSSLHDANSLVRATVRAYQTNFSSDIIPSSRTVSLPTRVYRSQTRFTHRAQIDQDIEARRSSRSVRRLSVGH